ncbi:hypothetical protein FRC02_004621 [Tulasnella sp. 418]|nr:hypothetical protein FRC02_004621 [Tulasnella sp. 418]
MASRINNEPSSSTRIKDDDSPRDDTQPTMASAEMADQKPAKPHKALNRVPRACVCRLHSPIASSQ